MAFIASAPISLNRSQVSLSTRKHRVCSVSSRNVTSSSILMKASGGSRGDYWRGEWLCVDCGYVYKPGRKVKFEDLPSSWKCPQCNAPKRRFAKKAGDYVQETEAPRAKRANQTPCMGPPLSPEIIASVEESRRSSESMRPTYPEFAHSEPYRFPEIPEIPQLPTTATAASTVPPTPPPTAPPTPTPSRYRARTPMVIRGPQRTSPESTSMPVLPQTHFEPISRLNRRSNDTETPQLRHYNSSSILQRAKAWKKRNNIRSRVEKSSGVKAAIAHKRRLRRDDRRDDDSTTQTSPSFKRRERRTSMDVAVLRKLSDLTAKRRGSDLAAEMSSGGTDDISPLRRSFEVARKSIKNARKSIERKSNRMSVQSVTSCLSSHDDEHQQQAIEEKQDSLPMKHELDDADMQTEETEIVSQKEDDSVSLDSCSVSYAPVHDDNCSMMSDYPVSLDIMRVSRASFGYDRTSDEPSLNRRLREENRDSIATAQSYSYGFEQQEKRNSQDRPSIGASMNSFDMCDSSPSFRADDQGFDEIDNSRRYEDSDLNNEYVIGFDNDDDDDDYRTAYGGLDEEEEEYGSVVRSISSELTVITSSSSSEGTISRVELPSLKSFKLRRTGSSVALPTRRRADRVINERPIRPCIPVRLTVEPKLRERYGR